MIHAIQRNFFFIWIFVLLGIVLVLTLTLTGCSSGIKTGIPIEGKAAAVLNNQQQIQSGCTDSDGGINKEVKGTVVADGIKRSDLCYGPYVVEYYCDNGKLANVNVKCECNEGKCS